MTSVFNIDERALAFACDVVRLYQRSLKRHDARRLILSQLLRSGTSVGANLAEARAAQSRADFIAKARIALKEARESHYWLRILQNCELISAPVEPLIDEANELVAILTAIVKKSSIKPRPSPT